MWVDGREGEREYTIAAPGNLRAATASSIHFGAFAGNRTDFCFNSRHRRARARACIGCLYWFNMGISVYPDARACVCERNHAEPRGSLHSRRQTL